MRRLLLLLVIATFAVGPADAKDPPAEHPPIPVHSTGTPYNLDRGAVDRFAAGAQVDTTVLGVWTFDVSGLCTAEGWTSMDRTFQPTYFHVDDFAGLGGGTYGRLVALEGNQSMWCGLRPDANDPELCQYLTLPGYGNNWAQALRTADCLTATGDVTLSYQVRVDVEPGEDYAYVRYDRCDDDWQYFHTFRWNDDLAETRVIPDSLHSGQLRIEFFVDTDGAWSDHDGLWDTDGAMIVDSVTVADATGALLPTELFETETPGATESASGNWVASLAPWSAAYGDFAGLFEGVGVVQENCPPNVSCFWGFFSGSTADYACGGFPNQPAVPYHTGDNIYLNNEIWSPYIPLSGEGNEYELMFDVYRDLPLDAAVFYQWQVRSIVDGCPTRWDGTNFVNYGEEKAWVQERASFGVDVVLGATHIQIALAAIDLCDPFCWLYGFSGDCHSHSPLFDNVVVRRLDVVGPRWNVTSAYLFQDNFPGDGTVGGTVRADTPYDIFWWGSPFVPADSVIVEVDDPSGQIGVDTYTGTGPSIYMWAAVRPPGQPGKSGSALTDDDFRWPVVDSLDSNGDTWYQIRMDYVFLEPERINQVLGDYCVDLNDALFTPGDTVLYYFSAENDEVPSVVSYWSEYSGTTNDRMEVETRPMDFDCFPGWSATSSDRVLYVDRADGGGSQVFFETAFSLLGLEGAVDRFDIRNHDDGLGTRVADPLQQLVPVYNAIVWSAGKQEGQAVPDGENGKSDDFTLLKTYLDNLTNTGGVYLCGDHVATMWESSPAAGAASLRAGYLDFGVANQDHVVAGLGTNPLVIGTDGGCFDHPAGPDTTVVFGGCGVFGHFDVLTPLGAATEEASYNGGQGAAVVAQRTTNPQAMDVGVMLSGFGLEAMRDDRPAALPDRAEHLGDILMWLAGLTTTPTDAVPTIARNALAQNYPNPFNPATEIAFSLREKAKATLHVYNVRGQLVKTLVEDERAAGITHRVGWNGRNDAGQRVASGVYFYRLVAGDFTRTRKMVLLK